MFTVFSTRHACVAVTLMCVCALTVKAQSEEFTPAQSLISNTAIPPYALFQYSSLTGSGDTITASEVPVITSTGATIFKNLTLQFSVDSSGNLGVSTGYPKVIAAPPPIVNAFKAGKYIGPAYDTNYIITVAGPGTTAGGATEWSVTTPTGANYYTHPGTATWYVGPLSTSPIAARLSKAGITSTAWSYGVATTPASNGDWYTNTLIGVSQIGNSITFVSFTDYYGDHNLPVDQITYTLSQ